jgi:hypothetical protein
MRKKKYEISGPGVKRAVQEAVKARKNIVFVYDYDSLGRILRIGYAFADGKEYPPKFVRWFKEGEVHIDKKEHKERDHRVADLKVEYNLPSSADKGERQFLLELPLGKSRDIILRNIFRLRGNMIKSFVVQAEIRVTEKDKKKWNPLVRYDCAHGFIHRDLINLDGKQVKEKLASQNLKHGVDIAIQEIKCNLKLWMVKLGYESRVLEIFEKIDINEELDAAKEFLQRLIQQPEIINKTPSTFMQIKDAIDYVKKIWPP